MRVQIYPDFETVSQKAAEMFLQMSERFIADKGRFAVALSGGNTPKRLYALFGSEPYARIIDWTRIHLFWADERCVPPEHPDSNYRLAFDAFLSKVPLPEGNVHRIRGEAEPARGAEEYERDISRFFGGHGLPGFDLIMLGIGEDGHTASIFPGSKILDEEVRLVDFVDDRAKNHPRITLTPRVLTNADNIIVMISGKNKASIVRKIIGGRDPSLPASRLINGKGYVLFLMDKDAGSLLNT